MLAAGALANVDALEDATLSFHWCWELRTFTGLPKAVKAHADAARKHRKQVGRQAGGGQRSASACAVGCVASACAVGCVVWAWILHQVHRSLLVTCALCEACSRVGDAPMLNSPPSCCLDPRLGCCVAWQSQPAGWSLKTLFQQQSAFCVLYLVCPPGVGPAQGHQCLPAAGPVPYQAQQGSRHKAGQGSSQAVQGLAPECPAGAAACSSGGGSTAVQHTQGVYSSERYQSHACVPHPPIPLTCLHPLPACNCHAPLFLACLLLLLLPVASGFRPSRL